MPGINVNILLHGLFFMMQEGNNLRVYAPVIPRHHFIGGIRGSRLELPTPLFPNPQDFTGWGLSGKTPDPKNDVDGAIMQFSPNDVGGLKPPNDSAFKGTILLPWPTKIIALRTGDIVNNFKVVPTSIIGKRIIANATAKRSLNLGVVAMLQYTLPALNPVGGVTQISIHYYLQPCKNHSVKEVNDDLGKVRQSCFNTDGFDLEFITGPQEPPQVLASGNPNLGTTTEDEQSVDEEFNRSPDIRLICQSDPPAPVTPSPSPQEAMNPANCPVFFVG